MPLNSLDKKLLEAARKGDCSEVVSLLSKGANVNVADDNGGWTPLRNVCVTGHVECAGLLIDMGADVDAVDEAGWTPLHYATKFGYVELVRLLIANGADVNASNRGRTPLQKASYEGHVKVARLLVENGADVCATSYQGYTPVHYLCDIRRVHDCYNGVTAADRSDILKALLESSLKPLTIKSRSLIGGHFVNATPLDIARILSEEDSSSRCAAIGRLLRRRRRRGSVSEMLKILFAFDSVGNCEPGVEVEENVIVAALETFCNLNWPKGVEFLLQRYPNVSNRIRMGAMPTYLSFIGRYSSLNLMYLIMTDYLISNIQCLDHPTTRECKSKN